jgi:hypothetical protein
MYRYYSTSSINEKIVYMCPCMTHNNYPFTNRCRGKFLIKIEIHVTLIHHHNTRMTMGMGQGRNRLVSVLLLAGCLSVNASERLRGVRRTARDGGYKSTKNMRENDVHLSAASEGPRANGGRTGISDQAESAGIPNQTGSQTVFTSSNDRYVEGRYGAGRYKANIFQKAHRGPTVYKDVEQEPQQSENSDEVYKVSNDTDILSLFESSSESIKRKSHSPATVWPLAEL